MKDIKNMSDHRLMYEVVNRFLPDKKDWSEDDDHVFEFLMSIISALDTGEGAVIDSDENEIELNRLIKSGLKKLKGTKYNF